MSEIVADSKVRDRSSRIAVAEEGEGEEDELAAAVEVEEDRENLASEGVDPRIQINEAGKGRNRMQKARKILMYPFRNISKLYSNSTTTAAAAAPTNSSTCSITLASGIPLGSSAKYPYFYGERPIGRCYFCCVSPPPVAEDSVSGNDDMPSVSSYEYVKNLIEMNDFYSVDSNVHRDYCARIPPR